MDQLLKLLEQNAKLTTDQLSALLGKTEEEIASAIKEYEKENVIVGYNALVNWEKIDPNDCTAVIELKVQPKRDHGYDEIAAEFESKGYGDFKVAVAEAVIEALRPIQEKYNQVYNEKDYLAEIYKKGAAEAERVANKTLYKVMKKVGYIMPF